ncbi:hypothetical protein KIN20_033177 [Parelaphostrongylus tenuis]|uniref:Uncharacterized protein n=1 Tax=Parelaphostrongylus tenuis TaxID=148309 RepID=A0AAD5R9W2_PARTN|nr:hypothetical protein KIN20_033177 [Parelaphostrongylus tenuis]
MAYKIDSLESKTNPNAYYEAEVTASNACSCSETVIDPNDLVADPRTSMPWISQRKAA